MPWVRSGECSRCGECCKGAMPGNDGTAKVEGYCQLFEWLGGKGHCGGHGQHEYYLAGCNVWPQHPDNIADKPSCTYTFTWVDD